jgi:hypothetical protein
MGLVRDCITKLVEVNEWFGDREEKWGWSRVVGILGVGAVGWGGVFPILGMIIMRARWSLWLMSEVVMVASVGWKCDVGGRRRSHWFNGEFVGIYVGVWGSPIWVRDVVLQNSFRGG